VAVRPLQDFITAMTTAWEAATPPSDIDTSGVLYRCVDSFEEERGAGRHRQFMWHFSDGFDVRGETPNQYDWSLKVTFFFHRDSVASGPQTKHTWIRAVHEDISKLVSVLHAQTQWNGNPGVLGPVLDGWDLGTDTINPGKNGGGTSRGLVARVTFNLRVLTMEI